MNFVDTLRHHAEQAALRRYPAHHGDKPTTSMTQTELKNLLKGNTVAFFRYRKGYLYYTIADRSGNTGWTCATAETPCWEFPVPIADCGDATFLATDKAITFMRYIRKAQEDGTFVRVSTK